MHINLQLVARLAPPLSCLLLSRTNHPKNDALLFPTKTVDGAFSMAREHDERGLESVLIGVVLALIPPDGWTRGAPLRTTAGAGAAAAAEGSDGGAGGTRRPQDAIGSAGVGGADAMVKVKVAPLAFLPASDPKNFVILQQDFRRSVER